MICSQEQHWNLRLLWISKWKRFLHIACICTPKGDLLCNSIPLSFWDTDFHSALLLLTAGPWTITASGLKNIHFPRKPRPYLPYMTFSNNCTIRQLQQSKTEESRELQSLFTCIQPLYSGLLVPNTLLDLWKVYKCQSPLQDVEIQINIWLHMKLHIKISYIILKQFY